VLRRRRIGAHQGEDPVAEAAQRGPDLLSVDHELVALAHRPGAQRGEVAAGVGLAVALAPDLVAGEDAGEVSALLLRGAVDHQGGAEQAHPQSVDPVGRAGEDVLLVEDRLLHHRGAAAAVLPRPGDGAQAGVEEGALPAAVALEGLAARLPVGRPGVLDLLTVIGEPAAHLVAEGGILAAQLEVHASNLRLWALARPMVGGPPPGHHRFAMTAVPLLCPALPGPRRPATSMIAGRRPRTASG
jgi:hypothetical protein